MAKTNDFQPEAVNAMLKAASAKLGMSPAQLRAMLSDPKKSNELLNSVCGKGGGQAKKALSSEKALENFLNKNPQAKKLLGELMGEKRDG